MVISQYYVHCVYMLHVGLARYKNSTIYYSLLLCLGVLVLNGYSSQLEFEIHM